MPTTPFPPISFKGALRDSQQRAVDVIRRQLRRGEKRLHIVAPPGSGKTVLGLYVWAHLVRTPVVVLSPTAAIQMQWAARTSLFDLAGYDHQISTDPHNPGLFTSLTYQSVTLPRRGDADLEAQAVEHWRLQLIEKGQAGDDDEAQLWLDDLRTQNPRYFADRLAAYTKKIRDELSRAGESLQTLHSRALKTIQSLRRQNVGLIVLDECHHLMGHWGRVLADAHDLLDGPIVLGLTATPPDARGRDARDVSRYDAFFGPVDFEVPTPALVRERNLAPYQDLAYFVRPTGDELTYIARADEQFFAVIDALCAPRDEPGPALGHPQPDSAEPALDSPDDATPSVEPDAPPADDSPSIDTADDAPPAADPVDSSADPADPVDPAADPVDASADSSGTAAASTSEGERTPPLAQWLSQVLAQRSLPTGVSKSWSAFARRDRELADMGRLFLLRRGLSLPDDVPQPGVDLLDQELSDIAMLAPVLDRYVRNGLRRSPHAEDQALARRVAAQLRLLGMQITDTGIQPCASPVSRVIAYARGKAEALGAILKAEHETLGDRIRAVVVTDYEKSSSMGLVGGPLDAEAGGAVAAFRALVRDAHAELLDPVLVTGSTVLVDADLADRFLAEAKRWLTRENVDVRLAAEPRDGCAMIVGSGADWSPRLYVRLITELFQRGVTRCLVGTRGLLGEGWDAHRVNVLVDLTTVTTSMMVNQLRGRSMRLDPDWPEKVANNWDVVCVADEFARGLDDYLRFRAKHETLYGVTDDGAIEKGVGHVHAAFTDMKPEGLAQARQVINAEMLHRAAGRTRARRSWRLGEPFNDEAVRALEVKPGEGFAVGMPTFTGSRDPWTSQSLTMAIGRAVLGALVDAQLVREQSQMQFAHRDGGYMRLFLNDANPEDTELFVTALHEAMGPLRNPRYVVPRVIDEHLDTWLSRMLPQIVGQYFRKKHRRRVMLHAVPSALAKNKELAELYQIHWNTQVSPGDVAFALRGEGRDLLDHALREGLSPTGRFHHKALYR